MSNGVNVNNVPATIHKRFTCLKQLLNPRKPVKLLLIYTFC